MVTVIMGRNVRRIIESSIILIEEKLSSNSSGPPEWEAVQLSGLKAP